MTRKQLGSDAFDPDLEWFLVAGSAAMRERGTLGAVVSVLELGGVDRGGVPNTDLYTDAQVGFGRTPIGDVERVRWLSAAWFRLSRSDQQILLACYLAPRARYRSDEGFGARDKCPAVEELKRGGVTEPRTGKHDQVRTGVEAQFGELSGLAFHLCDNPEKLLSACQDPRKQGHAKTIGKAYRAAKAAATEAHRAWREAKTGKPRTRRDRVSIQPPHVREEL